MFRHNGEQLIETAIQGQPVYPGASGWRVSHDGQSLMLPGVGGITYNLKLGDSAYGWAADHAEPCVSATASYDKREQGVNLSFNYFACVGNEARILTGEAKGTRGIVTGTHGGCEHVMIDFPPAALDVLSFDDKIQIRARGQGLKLLDYPELKIWSLDPVLLGKMGLEEDQQDRKLRLPVAGLVPAELLGSGLGRTDGFKADIDIQTSDWAVIEEHKLDQLKLGDMVALLDYKSFYGWSYQKGAVTIGVVTHTDSYTAGHGPGVTTLITSLQGELLPFVQPDANLGRYLKIGRYRN
ncbi:MAG: DUF4438 domain-containing protein [Candidatus Melainabacteria bacterium HGW-Melainabacteria-1]|nr:MAG: DUF4438 domain-containing protein [Candidatus Melainabacteria bacterium HGW-Melainabacteria-1]